ncbi:MULTISPECIES: DUF1508 domain-containing protein [Bradyrhizobium]|uniref:DUF1508 domain-containing protein n=1 Tax=Bradyrhizobium frederickii TaxID=2560054 RepID=A0A4Y9NT75_9BRAD|nr:MULTISPECIES: DUF1508 domain-containing protein [Bradyrhizobium]RTE91028.1 DUF1508 domain-containing protein [Bradyrhizobium sp. LVM 105]TFV35226.1 DUF1508 domain-containing protein [Bradyrhizobium frederickii]TFV69475.1 DUF1508 domain-containing protein [Bradyrhizobium frederickii]
MYFQLYRDARNEWRWTLYSVNERKIADSGEGYHNKVDCLGAIELVKSTDASTRVRE